MTESCCLVGSPTHVDFGHKDNCLNDMSNIFKRFALIALSLTVSSDLALGESIGPWTITRTPAEYGSTTTSASVQSTPSSPWDPRRLVLSCNEGMLPSDYLVSNGAQWTEHDDVAVDVDLQVDKSPVVTQAWILGGRHIIGPGPSQSGFQDMLIEGSILKVAVHVPNRSYVGHGTFKLDGIASVVELLRISCSNVLPTRQ